MNSLFNYELDERAIRLTLRDTDLQFSESAWEDFDNNYTVVTTKATTEWKLPNVEMNINRNVLVPVFFIAVLGGVSAMIFSFADFKTNKTIQSEQVLNPDPGNYKKPEETKAALSPVNKEENKKPVQEVKTVSVPAENKIVNVEPKAELTDSDKTLAKSAAPSISSSSPAPTTSLAVSSPTHETVAQPLSPIVAKSYKPESNDGQGLSGTSSAYKQQGNYNGTNYRNSKRKKHVTPEQIETIKVPSLTGQETSAQEPELELKLN